jgi:beta-glucosidase
MSQFLELNRRTVLAQGAAGLAATGLAVAAPRTASAAAARGGAFPKGFLWGAGTAGHQYEGNNVASDLWVVEHLKPSPFHEPSGDACDGYHRYPEDIALLRSLGLNTFRFSIEWSRIEPEEGQFSRAELDFYRRVLETCHKHGVVPNVTLNHFVSPRWFAARGAWERPDAPDLFARYAERVGKHLGDLFGLAVPFNEPNAPLVVAWSGTGAPGGADQAGQESLAAGMGQLLKAAGRKVGSETFSSFLFSNPVTTTPAMVKAHHMARQALKAGPGDFPVGAIISMAADHVLPGGEEMLKRKQREVYSAWLEAAAQSDFLGVQTYSRSWIGPQGPTKPPAGTELTKSGWAFDPEALGAALRYAASQVSVPLYVTENGISTDDDGRREVFIRRALASMKAAIDDGVDVRGYYHWTLVDNWEWNEGFKQTFGLVSFDHQTFKRTVKPSARVYGQIAKRNRL